MLSGSVESDAMPQLFILSVVLPAMSIALLPVGARAKVQAKPLLVTPATARVVIVTLDRKKLASDVLCCSARMTSTLFASPTCAPLVTTGGLLAHICPALG